jgi:uncharacterized protein YkwD
MASRTRSGSTLLFSAATLFTFSLPRGCDTPPPAPAPAAAPVAAVPATDVSAEVQRVVDLSNAERAARGLGPVVLDGRLVAAAQGHSNDMANFSSLNHDGSDYSSAGDRIERQGYDFNYWSENIAAGYATSDAVTTGWMNSSGHRKNILSSKVVHIGVAVAYSADGTPYWTMNLAAGG